MNATDLVLDPAKVRERADAPALLFHDRTVSYGELLAAVNRFGNGLAALGVERENRVAMLLKDTPDMVAAYLGTMKIGAVSLAMNVRAAPADIAFMLQDSRAKVLLVDAEFLPAFESIEHTLTHPPKVFVANGAPGARQPIEAIIAGRADSLEATDMSPDDMALWVYTSGTTGTPKAAVHLHHNIAAAVDYSRGVLGVGPGDRLFATSKLFFAYSLGNCLFGSLMLGAASILFDGWPDSAAITDIVKRHRPTLFYSVPTMYRNLLRDGLASRETFGSVRVFIVAGERLPAVLFDRWKAATGGELVDGMGTSETIYMIISNPPGRVRVGASGLPVPNVHLEIRNDRNEVIDEPGTSGVLWVRAASVADRYWNQQARSHAAFIGGWFRTGDMYQRDSDGYWYHEGRADDMLRVSGQWVSPAEIEDHVLRIPGIADAAVVGVENADGLMRLVMFAVPAEPGADRAGLIAANVQEHLRDRLSIYKIPRDVRVVPEIPRTTTGKVQRFKLRDQAKGKTA